MIGAACAFLAEDGGVEFGVGECAYGEAAGRYKFGHLAEHRIPGGPVLLDSYHCSRYNQNTGRLTDEMFAAVFERAKEIVA